MNSTKRSGKELLATEIDLSDAMIYVAGSMWLANQLVVHYVEKNMKIQCKGLPAASIKEMISVTDRACRILILYDYGELNETESLLHYTMLNHEDEIMAALFNVPRGNDVEQKALPLGIRGVFYQDDSLKAFTKGIRAILYGDLWFSRSVLSKLVTQRGKIALADPRQQVLTDREKQVLVMIACGQSNNDIAATLGISPHTVKTHLYNMYQKINVRNRVAAARWATSNLSLRQ